MYMYYMVTYKTALSQEYMEAQRHMGTESIYGAHLFDKFSLGKIVYTARLNIMNGSLSRLERGGRKSRPFGTDCNLLLPPKTFAAPRVELPSCYGQEKAVAGYLDLVFSYWNSVLMGPGDWYNGKAKPKMVVRYGSTTIEREK
ncbi:hypothetical protein ANO14919_106400 [Xylariales sp. No.14919]|nr:hypothetical protein ANO14919_106400 [Xylariales sp. No.14919]